MPGLPRSALLVVWGNAWCVGAAAPAQVVTRVQRDDEPHDVVWPSGVLPGAAQPQDLAAALETLRGAGMDGLRLALTAPGHPVGPAGAPEFAQAARDAGEAALAVRRGPPETVVAGLVPAVRPFGPPGDEGHLVTWRVLRLPDAGPVVPGTSLAEADRELRETLIDAAATLQGIARAAIDLPASQQLAPVLADLRAGRGEQVLPAPYGPRAQDVAARAVRLLTVVDLATVGATETLTAHAAQARVRALAPLAHAARRALVAACDSVLEPVHR